FALAASAQMEPILPSARSARRARAFGVPIGCIRAPAARPSTDRRPDPTFLTVQPPPFSRGARSRPLGVARKADHSLPVIHAREKPRRWLHATGGFLLAGRDDLESRPAQFAPGGARPSRTRLPLTSGSTDCRSAAAAAAS